MYQAVTIIALSGTLDKVADSIVDASGGLTTSILKMVKGVIDNTVIPLVLVALFVTMLFLIASIVYDKHKGETDGLENKTKALLITLCVFVALAGYGLIWGNLMASFIG